MLYNVDVDGNPREDTPPNSPELHYFVDIQTPLQLLLPRCSKNPQKLNNVTNPKWAEDRLDSIGASEVPTVLGLYGASKKKRLFEEKVKRIVRDDAPNYWMQRGNELEPVARDIYRSHGHNVIEVGMVRHETFPWLTASSDGVVLDQGMLMEIKTPIRPPTISPTCAYWIQCQIQMEVCNMPQCMLLRVGKEWVGVEQYYAVWDLIVRDTKWFDSVKPTLERFWKSVEAERIKSRAL